MKFRNSDLPVHIKSTHALGAQDHVEMVRSDQCKPCSIVAKAFFGEQWGALLRKSAEKPAFRAEWKAAEQKYATIVDVDPNMFDRLLFEHATSVGKRSRVFISLESWFWFLRVTEFQSRFKFAPGVLGIPIIKIGDEQGNKSLTGCLVRPSSGEPMSLAYRIVRFVNENGLYLDEEYVNPAERLSENQPTITLAKMGKDQAKSLDQDCRK